MLSYLCALALDQDNAASCVSGYAVRVPCIRNTEAIAPGAEIVLRWEKKKVEAKKTGGKREN